MRDPRYKHEYLDRVRIWTTVTEGNGDESDKHVEARDRRYSCLICFPFQLFSKVPLISDILLHFKADRFSWKKPKPCFFVDSDVFIITLINMAGRNVLISWEKHTRAKNFHVNFWRCSVIFTSHKSFQMLIFVQASISESVFHPGMKDF